MREAVETELSEAHLHVLLCQEQHEANLAEYRRTGTREWGAACSRTRRTLAQALAMRDEIRIRFSLDIQENE